MFVLVSRIAFWLVAAALALAVGLASATIVNQVKNPITAIALGIGPAGVAEGNLAFATFAARQKQDPKALVSRKERALATKSYRSEPLSSAALGMLIASMTDPANAATRQALLDVGGKLTRRSSLITSASIEGAALDGDEPTFFLWLSRAILTNEGLRAAYIKAMAQATARPGAEAALAPVLGPDPKWADYYWRVVMTLPESVVNAAKLRVALARNPWKQTEIQDTDRFLATQLARFGHFGEARDFAIGMGQKLPTSANLVVNSDFDATPLIAPIDWQLNSEGNLGALIDPKGKYLSISAISGARGYAARQLIRLEPGRYSVGWALRSGAAISDGTLTARLQCAEDADSTDGGATPLAVGAHRQTILLSASSCRWFWLEVAVNVPDGNAGFDAQLDYIRLTSASGAEMASPRSRAALEDAGLGQGRVSTPAR